jgi:hypothetical protein
MRSSNILKDYLGKKDLTENLILTNNLSFHWANWDETCIHQRKLYKNFNQNFHLSKLNNNLTELKSVPIWLCNKVKVVKSDLYSLYESYLDSRLRLTWFDRKEEILFSLDCEQGPYQTLTTMKWMDKQIYSQFVLRKILLDYFTLRSFRLNTTVPTIFKMDNDVNSYDDKVEIHQISEAGVILKFKDKNFYNKIKSSKKMEIKIPIKAYIDLSDKSLEETLNILGKSRVDNDGDYKSYTLDSRVLNYYGNTVNTKRSSDGEFYLFARYEDFISDSQVEDELSMAFRTLVEKTKQQFDKDLTEIKIVEEKKSA